MSQEKIWKFFGIPSPKELGWSDSNALPMRDLQSTGDDTPTWEDWEEHIQKNYPIRYFFADTALSWFRKQWRKVEHTKYWFVSHFIPSRRYHLLDLRQPKVKGEYTYRWGWIDSDTQIVYALFSILNNFVKDELPTYYCPDEDAALKEPHLLNQRNFVMEVKAIHHWWNVERIREEKKHAKLLSDWHNSKKAGDPAHHQLWVELKNIEKVRDEKEDEMIDRLIKIRRSLWT